jgi:hypothetical protein
MAAAIPALVTLGGTVWQIYARHPIGAGPASRAADIARGDRIRVEQLATHRPATTVHPWFARVMVIWHVVVAATFVVLWLRPIDVPPFGRLDFLIPLAMLYLLGAAFYAVKYRSSRTADLGSWARLEVEAEPRPLFERCRSSLAAAGLRLTTVDFSDSAEARAAAEIGGARLALAITELRETAHGETVRVGAEHRNRAAGGGDHPPGARYRVLIESTPTRRVDGLARATQCTEGFLASFLA